MNDKLKPYADLKYKAREYEDKETGKMKGVWIQVGTLFSTPHGSHMSIKMDTMPVGEWNGWLSVYPRDEAKDNSPMPLKTVQDAIHSDNLPSDEEGDKPIDISQIPF